MKKRDTWDQISQFGLPFFTVLGFSLTAMKMPQYGLLSNLIAQIFWIPSSYKAWKEAGQIGIFVATLCIATVITIGVLNYWVFI